jgi:hypothetical protein
MLIRHRFKQKIFHKTTREAATTRTQCRPAHLAIQQVIPAHALCQLLPTAHKTTAL